MNEGNTMSCDEGSTRHVTTADDADDPQPEPHADTDDPVPDEAGYGYGV